MLGLWKNRSLLLQLTRRDIEQRYRSSALGFLWLFAQPLIMLALYSFVFEVVLRARWGVVTPGGVETPFGMLLFIGLVLHVVMAEMLTRAPAAITSHVSYVKRVIFPVEILPVVFVLSSLVTQALALALLFIATFVFHGGIPLSAFLVVVPLGALAILTLGLAWIMAALGVYLRDLAQVTPHVSMIMMFTAPIVYPRSMVPAEFQWLLALNPLTLPVEMARKMMFEGIVDFTGLPAYLGAALVVLLLGRLVFARLRVGFADVL